MLESLRWDDRASIYELSRTMGRRAVYGKVKAQEFDIDTGQTVERISQITIPRMVVFDESATIQFIQAGYPFVDVVIGDRFFIFSSDLVPVVDEQRDYIEVDKLKYRHYKVVTLSSGGGYIIHGKVAK